MDAVEDEAAVLAGDVENAFDAQEISPVRENQGVDPAIELEIVHAVRTADGDAADIFGVFVVAYLFYIGKSLSGPYPKDVLDVPVLATICLLSSSISVALGERALRRGEVQRSGLWLLVTVALGGGFTPEALFDEVRTTTAYRALSPAAWQWCLDFVRQGGPSPARGQDLSPETDSRTATADVRIETVGLVQPCDADVRKV